MKYQEFRDKYNGRWLDWDGCYGCQCWDLAQVYFTECLKLPSSVLSGCGLVSNMLYPPKRKALDQYFDEVDVHAMYPGDVCIWEYGHIAIFDHWDGYNCWYFSQNPNPSQVMKINSGGLHAFRLKSKEEHKDEYINIPPSIEVRNIYNVDTKKQFNVIKPKKFGGLSYKILGYEDNKKFAVIQTVDFGKVLVKITDMTPITNKPQYSHGNF